ncbi:MAG: hypothetical protein ISS48_01825 [Candidatus Aenigmarchaeota archaeon]|nr:hypothetical protein [Candidatus Aenigmarchaeota archaeon]
MKKFLALLTICILSIPSALAFYEAFTNVVGVDNHGNGIMGNVSVEIQPGKGRVLVDTTPLQGIYTQDSERIAVEVASDITGFDFSDYDAIYSITTSSAHVIDGPSAGGSLALVTIAAIEGKEISQNFAMTGTINEDGSIGQIGEVLVKANAVADHGITVFLIPEGQEIQNQYVKKIKRPQPGWYIETIEPISVNITEYADDHWGMKIYEVSDINEVMKYAFGEIPKEIKKEIKPFADNITLPKFTSPVEDYNEFSWMVADEISRAEKEYYDIKEKLEKSDIPEDIKLELNEIMKRSYNYLEDVREYQKQGYGYSSANEAFKSLITSNVVNDIIEYYSSSNKKRYLDDRVNGMKKEINETKEDVTRKTEKMICDPDKFEWAVAARERITYAENRVNSIELPEKVVIMNNEIQGVNPLEIFYKINTAKEWAEISKNFAKKSGYLSADSNCVEKFKEKAEGLVEEAENQFLLQESLGTEDIEDVEWYLDAARAELEQGWYITSIYDATSALTRIKMISKYNDKDINEIYHDFNQTEVITQDLLGTIFLENSYYNIYQAIKDNSQYDALFAIQTLMLSKETNEIYHDIKNKIGKPSLDWSFDFRFDLDSEDYITILMVVVGALILYVFVLALKIKKLERKLNIRRRRKSKYK